jgi:hypothetical protein
MFGGSLRTQIAVGIASAAASLAAPANANNFREELQPQPAVAPMSPPTTPATATPATAPAHEMVKMTINGASVEMSSRPLVLSNKDDLGIFEARIVGKSAAETMAISGTSLAKEAFKIGRLPSVNLATDYAIPSLALRDQSGKTVIDGMNAAGITGAAIAVSKTAGEYALIVDTPKGKEAVLFTSKDISTQKVAEYQRVVPGVMAEALKLYGVDVSGGTALVPGSAPALRAATPAMTPDQLAEAMKTAKPYSETYKDALSGVIPTNSVEILKLKAQLSSLSQALDGDILAVKSGQMSPEAQLAIKRLLGVDAPNAGHLKEAELNGNELKMIAGGLLKQVEDAGRTSKADERKAEKAAEKERISPSNSSLGALQEAAQGAYAAKYQVELSAVPPRAYQRGAFTTGGTAREKLNEQMNEVTRNLTGLDAVIQGTKADEKTLRDAMKKGINAQAQAAAVRLGMSPEAALNLKPEDLQGLVTKADELQKRAGEQVKLNKASQSDIKREMGKLK